MIYMNKLLKKLQKEKHHSLLGILLIFFIVFDVKIPADLANLIDTIVGKTVVILVIFSLLTYNYNTTFFYIKNVVKYYYSILLLNDIKY